MYPEFTFKELAPRIDVTRREAPTRRDVSRRESGGDRRDRTGGRLDVEDLLDSADLGRSEYPADVGRLVEKLHRDLERRRRIERERRGL